MAETFLTYPISCFVIWLSWRIWRFTIRPWLEPRQPKELPYIIPWVGSAISFFADSGKTIYSGIKNRKRSVFALHLAGDTIYVVTNPKDVSAVYKNTTTLAFDVFIGDLMLQCGSHAKDCPENVPGATTLWVRVQHHRIESEKQISSQVGHSFPSSAVTKWAEFPRPRNHSSIRWNHQRVTYLGPY